MCFQCETWWRTKILFLLTLLRLEYSGLKSRKSNLEIITIWFWILALFQIELFKSLMRPFQLFSTIVCLSKLKSIIPLKVGKRNALRGKKWNYWLLSQCWKIVQKSLISILVINEFFLQGTTIDTNDFFEKCDFSKNFQIVCPTIT